MSRRIHQVQPIYATGQSFLLDGLPGLLDKHKENVSHRYIDVIIREAGEGERLGRDPEEA